jgi:hypothetical protein
MEFEVLKWLGKGAFGDVLKVIIIVVYIKYGGSTRSNEAHSSIVGVGTMLQARRSKGLIPDEVIIFFS